MIVGDGNVKILETQDGNSNANAQKIDLQMR